MGRSKHVSFLALALAGACRTSTPAPAEAIERQPLDSATAPASGSPLASAQRTDGLGSIYPDDVRADPLAARLCEALHLVPGRRVASCCGGEPRRYLYDQCVRVLSASVASRAIVVDATALQVCEASAAEGFAGCDWVTPSEPSAPAPCQRVLSGSLAEGAVCRSSLECAEKQHCAGLGPTRTGQCAQPRAIGSGCGVQADVLATYALQTTVEVLHPMCAAFCSLSSHRCEEAPEAGAKCFANVNCSDGQACVGGTCRSATADRAPLSNGPLGSKGRGPQCAVALPSAPPGVAPRESMHLPQRPLVTPPTPSR